MQYILKHLLQCDMAQLYFDTEKNYLSFKSKYCIENNLDERCVI